uniref:protein-tyrosine-phosphatase n=1 Tax=Plectus sambesii TaxID=2011161 RepID=A0A914XKK9_9BILA
MPLKLKLGKKSGRYDLSQDLYVLKVFLADQELLQCTLGADSTGRDCIEYISQKLEIQQVVMFGLRYQVRCSDPDKRMMRWVELDKPLRKQLEKWACKNRQVLLAVLYHTPNALALTDELARYYYFLLMRSDVVEGRLTVEMDKAIDLAAYSLQAEYGNHDPATHTIEFLQTIPLLPKHISRSAQILEDLLRRVAAYHDRLQGMQQSHASLLYIADAQQCEGYGEEFFFARDEDSTEVQIGYGQDGIVVRRTHVAPLKYRWEEIKEIHSSKRNLIIRQTEMSVFYFVMVGYLIGLKGDRCDRGLKAILA